LLQELRTDILDGTLIDQFVSHVFDFTRKKHVFFDNQSCLLGIFLDYRQKSFETDWLVVVVHEHGIETVISILELNDVLSACPNSVIILDREVFQSFYKTSLHIACLGCLDSCINESLSATHSVEKELSGSQAAVEAILYEALRGWILGIKLEVRETAIKEPVGHSLTINRLLTHKGYHLTKIDIRAF
jgi:hypothetical protein